MTPAERANPKMIDGSRRSRIAAGSGRTVTDVNGLVDRFFEARKLMTQMARGGMPGLGMPGMPGMPGVGAGGAKKKGKQKPAKGRRRSGNPAKAAAEEKAAAEKAASAPAANPFGNPGGEEIDYAKAAEQLNLPQDFSKYLK
jgi:signal recognition particle subunit SRP54